MHERTAKQVRNLAGMLLFSAQDQNSEFFENPVAPTFVDIALCVAAPDSPERLKCKQYLLDKQQPDVTWPFCTSTVWDTVMIVHSFRGHSLFDITVQNRIATPPKTTAIPAKAGIWNRTNLDSRMRGNDEIFQCFQPHIVNQFDLLDDSDSSTKYPSHKAAPFYRIEMENGPSLHRWGQTTTRRRRQFWLLKKHPVPRKAATNVNQ